MKLGIISTIGPAYAWAGSEEMWRGLAEVAIARGHSLLIHGSPNLLHSNPVSALKALGAQGFPRPELSPLTRRLAQRRLYSRYRSFFAQTPDVLCLSMGGIADCVWIPDLLDALRSSPIPYVVIVQANAEGLVTEEAHRAVLREFYSRAAQVVFVSEHNRTLAERQLGMAFGRSRILSNPLRRAIAQPLPWPPSARPLRFATVARLELADKQQDHLLEALATDRWKARDWHLTLFGSGPDDAHIRRLIAFYGLEQHVSLGGFVADFRDIWATHHLHILPSRREGLPLALIESMACGRPGIATHAGGSPELIDDGVNGWIVPGMHPPVLRDCLEQAWAERDRWAEMGTAAAHTIQAKLPQDWAETLLSLLLEAQAVTPKIPANSKSLALRERDLG